MARYLIDSNTVIDYLDNKLPANGMAFLNTVVDDIPNISVITKIEVLRFNAPPHVYKILTDFTDISVIYSLNVSIVDETISICKQYRIKLPDAIIAATSIVYNLTLITRNINDFDKITGLKTIDPYLL